MNTAERIAMIRLLPILLLVAFLLCGCPSIDVDDQDSDADGPTPTPTPEPITDCNASLVVDEETMMFALVSDECGVTFENIRGSLATFEPTGERQYIEWSDWPERKLTESSAGRTLTLSGSNQLPDMKVELEQDGDSLVIRQQLTATADVVVGGFNFYGHLTLPESPDRLRWHKNGYDSWTFAGVTELSPSDPSLPVIQHAYQPVGNNYDYFADRKQLSWWTAAMRGPENKPGLAAGALDTALFKTYFTGHFSTAAGNWIITATSGTPRDHKSIVKGQTLRLDPIMLQITPDPVQGLIDFAERYAADHPMPAWDGFEPKGWATWYDYYGDVTEDDLLANCEEMARNYNGFVVCQLDDGYIRHWGDWFETNDRFPSGLADLATQIAAMTDDDGNHLVPGLWMAPLMADKDSQLITDHPDWFVRDENGDYLKTGDAIVKKKRVLDITHPDARAWLTDTLAQIVDLGWVYLKLDFLFAGAAEGVRYDNSFTALEAYRLAMETIAEAVGENVYLLASGQPFLPTAGYFHAARTSSDICGAPIDAPLYFMTRNIARYNAARFFTQGILFDNDPDQLLVRLPLSDAQANLALASNVLLGGNLWLGDALIDLPEERADLIRSNLTATLENIDGMPIPLDLFDAAQDRITNVPYLDIVLQKSETPEIYVKGEHLAIINWSDHSQSYRIAVSDLPQDVTTLSNLVADETLTQAGGYFYLTVPELSFKVYRME